MKDITSVCGICNKKLSFWNQPVFGKGSLLSGEKICSSCFMKINNKSPKLAGNLKQYSLSDILSLLDKKPGNEPKITKKKVKNNKGDVGSHLSTKLLRILKSKTELSDEELNNLTESEGWGIVYSLRPKKEKLPQICFSGFSPSEKEELSELATQHNFQIVKSVTVGLDFLCIGDNAGPSKLKQAKKQKTNIISASDFIKLLETGEISS